MARMMEGQKPTAPGWRFVIQINNWLYYEQPQAHSDEWITCKLVAKGSVERKANYWFTRNIATGAFGFSRDFMLLKDHRPDVFKKLMDHIKNSA